MLNAIRLKVMERIKVMRDFANTWQTLISPVSQAKLDANKMRSCDCQLSFNGEHGFEVIEGEYGHTVDLKAMRCTYRYWELKGIPCAHAICAMLHMKIDPDTFVSRWYSKEKYLKAYGTVMQPIRGMHLWPKSDYPAIESPVIRKKPGRPKISRRKDKDEPKKAKSGKLSKKGVKMTCSLCHNQGHNKQGCPTRGQPYNQVSPIYW